jgi:hypothetical protein
MDLHHFDGKNLSVWMFQLQQNFIYYNTPNDLHKYMMASYHMEGEALTWLETMERSGVFTMDADWEKFVQLIHIRFGDHGIIRVPEAEQESDEQKGDAIDKLDEEHHKLIQESDPIEGTTHTTIPESETDPVATTYHEKGEEEKKGGEAINAVGDAYHLLDEIPQPKESESLLGKPFPILVDGDINEQHVFDERLGELELVVQKHRWRWKRGEEEEDARYRFELDKDFFKDGLTSYEVNFSYSEAGENKQDLGKLVTCERCAAKLHYKRRNENELEGKQEQEENKRKRNPDIELEEKDKDKDKWHPNIENGRTWKLPCVKIGYYVAVAEIMHLKETFTNEPLCWAEHMLLDNETGLDPFDTSCGQGAVDEIVPSSESLATKDYSKTAIFSEASEFEKKLDTGNIEEAESSLRESSCLNYEDDAHVIFIKHRWRWRYLKGWERGIILGLTGSVVLRSGQLSDIIAQLQELLKGTNEAKVPPYKYDTAVLAAHIQQLAQEIREFAVSSLVTIFNGDSTPNGSYASFLVPVVARGTMRYCYMGWKGWWLPDVESIGFGVESIQQMLYGLEVEIIVGWLIFRHFNHGKLNLAGAETVVWKTTHRLLCSLRYRWWKFRHKLLHAQALPLNQVTEVFLVPQFNGADPDQPRFFKKWKQQQEIEVTRQLFDEMPQTKRLGLIVPKYVMVQKFQDKDELYQDEEPVTVTQKDEKLKLQEGMPITSLKNFQDSVWPYQDDEKVFAGLLEQGLELRSDMVWESYWRVLRTRWQLPPLHQAVIEFWFDEMSQSGKVELHFPESRDMVKGVFSLGCGCWVFDPGGERGLRERGRGNGKEKQVERDGKLVVKETLLYRLDSMWGLTFKVSCRECCRRTSLEEIADKSSHQRLDLADFDARIQLAYQMKRLLLCFNSLVFPCKGASFIQLHTLWARCSKEGGIVTGGFLQDKWAISYTRGSTISFIRGSYWWYREVLLRSWAVLGDFKRCLDNVVLVASLSFAFYACFMRFSISRCRPLYKASLENVEVAC